LVTLPDNTLIFREKSVQVGVVDAKGVVQLHDVKVGRDFGVQSEILSGVTESDKVIVNPSDSLTTGTTVRIAANPAPSATPAAPAAPAFLATPMASATATPSTAPAASAAPDASATTAPSATPPRSAAKR
jgi:membrane fusion protein (multidrug efflux system)